MRIINPAIIILALALLITSCTFQGQSPTQVASNLLHRESVTTITYDTYPIKSPQKVIVFTNNHSPQIAYRVIGIAKVSKFNLLGIERQPEATQTIMKKLAASIGGDGLIDINSNGNQIQAKIIAYQKILI